MADQWPRQPREGCTPNLARLVFDQTGIDHYAVQVQDHSTSCVSTGWFEVASFRDRPRAKAVRDALNELFAQPGADLDFVHPTRLHAGSSAVVWTKARWSRTHDVWTKVGQCSDTAPDVKTFERLYATEPLVLAKVEVADVHWYEKPSWEIALGWANAIRLATNGWNCTKDARPEPDPPLFGGSILPLRTPTGTWGRDPLRISATHYGFGECQPSFQTANAEIFHTMDLLVAVPGAHYDKPVWTRDRWVRVRYGKRSAVARLTDVCGCADSVDLSRGLSDYLGFPGGGEVVISNP